MSSVPTAKRLLSHAEAAYYLNITEASLHSMNSRKRGPRSFKVGRTRRYDPQDVQAWLESRSSASPDGR